MMTDLLAAADKVTVDQAIAIAFSTQVWHAERWQARLKQAWQAASAADKTGDPQTIYTLIEEWDRHSSARLEGGPARITPSSGAWDARRPARPSPPRI